MVCNRIRISNRGQAYIKEELLSEAVNGVHSGLYTITKASIKLCREKP